MELLIGGDLVPTETNLAAFSSGDIDLLVDVRLLSLMSLVDVRIFNLEVPLTDVLKPIRKCGPNLLAPVSTVQGIKKLEPTVLCLANNHILDQDEQGLYTTLELLSTNNIDTVGAGSNLSEAAKPYVIKRNGKKIGIYACAEHEFTIAKENKAGANPFDPLESLDHISALKNKCDYVIVLYHGGKEHYRYPSPYLQKVCRKVVQKGADLVVCQHSHCIGAYEEYEGSAIIYGQGNFIFDKSDSEYWKTSLLIKVSINTGLQLDYIPIVKDGNGVRLATGQAAKEILSTFQQRSNAILQEGFIEQKYQEFVQENIQAYLRNFSGFGKWLSRIDRRLLNGALLKKKYNRTQLLAMQNYIECDAHRELVLAGLKGENESGKK